MSERGGLTPGDPLGGSSSPPAEREGGLWSGSSGYTTTAPPGAGGPAPEFMGVRIVWRNFPLPFHQNAMPAAEAAAEAFAQGGDANRAEGDAGLCPTGGELIGTVGKTSTSTS